MKSEKTPFKPGWYAAGHEPWDCGGTYCFIECNKLPKLDENLFDGKFQWLHEISHGMLNTYDENDVERLIKDAKNYNIQLPKAFLNFSRNAKLQESIPSCTACFLELSEDFIEVSDRENCYLLRFLNDQQSVLLWYLYLDAEGDHCVVVSEYFYENDIRKSLYEEVTIQDVLENTYFCSPSFEEFIYRFWIENTLWFSLNDGLELTSAEKEYLEAIKKNL